MSISLKYPVTCQKITCQKRYATKVSRDKVMIVLVVYLKGGVNCSLLFCRGPEEENCTQLRKCTGQIFLKSYF